ncbi:MAG: hypothetical protein H8E18_01815 [FCB group bacterium]|nr:hypothetical protein [FCB group bacterium]
MLQRKLRFMSHRPWNTSEGQYFIEPTKIDQCITTNIYILPAVLMGSKCRTESAADHEDLLYIA